MNTKVLPSSESDAIPTAVSILRAGGLVAFPTDTVYGLGALAFDNCAVESIYAAKGRSSEKAIPVLLGGVEDLQKVAVTVPEMALKLAASFWPGPLTLVVPKHPNLPQAISAGPTVAVRVPRHTLARELLQVAGPLAVTSANLSEQPSPVTAEQVLTQLDGQIPLILDGGQTPGGIPSTVVDCTGAEPKILRPGPVSTIDLFRALIRE